MLKVALYLIFWTTSAFNLIGRLKFIPLTSRFPRLLRPTFKLSMMNHAYDLVVIGGGSGGIAAAKRSVEYNAKVAVIEREEVGGSCINRACIPKTLLRNFASFGSLLHRSKKFGYNIDKFDANWAEMKDLSRSVSQKLSYQIKDDISMSNIELIKGDAAFDDIDVVKVNGKLLSSRYFLVATGSVPARLDIPGKEHCITSNEIFDIDTVADTSIAIIGGGFVAAEMSGIFQSLGARVQIFSRSGTILSRLEGMLGEALLQEMTRQGILFRGHCNVTEVVKDAASGKLTIRSNGEEFGPFNQVLMATGRIGNTASLNTAPAMLTINPQNECIVVDENHCSSAPNIFAVGDVIGEVQTTPMAVAAGRRLADRLFGGLSLAAVSYSNVPRVVFSNPPVATVGMTQQQAEDLYAAENVTVHSSSFTNIWHATLDEAERPQSRMKIVTLKDSGRIVGIHMIGLNCEEIIQGFAVAMNLGATKFDLDCVIGVHPTAAEEMVQMSPWGLVLPAGISFNPLENGT